MGKNIFLKRLAELLQQHTKVKDSIEGKSTKSGKRLHSLKLPDLNKNGIQ